MIDKFRSWLIRHRDQTAVSYNRFGRPGEDDDDKPPPTTIMVAPFNENSPEFMLFGVCHVQRASVYFACFGMAMVILSFITTFFEFDWYNQSKGVDIGALAGLFLYLTLGMLTHYYVIYGIKKQLSRFLLPFIAVYTIVCTFETFMCLALVFKIVEPDGSVQAHVTVTSAGTHVDVKNPPYIWILLGMVIIVCIQGVMLTAVLRCRQFLSQKQDHEMALKVAEKSKQEFPNIQIVLVNQTGPSGASNGNVHSFVPPVPQPSTTEDDNIGTSSSSPVGDEGFQRNGKPPSPPPLIQNII